MEIGIIKSVEFDFWRIELRTDNILTLEPFKSSETVTLGQLKGLLEVLIQVSGSTPRPFFSDNSHLQSLGFNERRFIGNNLHKFATASAVLENSPVVRFIGHTINHMFPPKVPMRLFSSKKEAIVWLIASESNESEVKH